MKIVKVKKKKNKDVSMQEELDAISSCLSAIEKLNNWDAEMRVMKYLIDRLKGESHRQWDEDR
jgi:hypothetical protein